MSRLLCVLLSIWFGMEITSGPHALARNVTDRLQVDYTVLVVLSQQEKVYTEVVTGIRAGMQEKNRTILDVLSVAEFMQYMDGTDEATQADMIVAVGTQAAKAVLSQASNIPVYVTLLPRMTYETLLQENEQARRAQLRSVSGIYIDQPFQR